MTSREELFGVVRTAVVDALGVDDDEVTPQATLLDELGAESIDLLDILFRLERKLGVKIQAADLAAYVQGGISDDEFADDNGVITERGLAHVKSVMPQVDEDSLRGNFQAEKVMSLFTVDNLTDLVASRMGAS